LAFAEVVISGGVTLSCRSSGEPTPSRSHEVGMGIAVPIMNAHGEVVAGLGVVGLQSRIKTLDVPAIIDSLLRVSATVSARLNSYNS
jgi:DNA-binding IclR family transcriptional regulator